jgi:hypothetical protein
MAAAEVIREAADMAVNTGAVNTGVVGTEGRRFEGLLYAAPLLLCGLWRRHFYIRHTNADRPQ